MRGTRGSGNLNLALAFTSSEANRVTLANSRRKQVSHRECNQDNIEASNISNYYYFPHDTKQHYTRAFENTRKEALEHLDLSPTLAARTYHVKDSLRKSVL
jgi:hypothetical protein